MCSGVEGGGSVTYYDSPCYELVVGELTFSALGGDIDASGIVFRVKDDACAYPLYVDFLLYADANNNDKYDEGERLGGVISTENSDEIDLGQVHVNNYSPREGALNLDIIIITEDGTVISTNQSVN